MNPLRVDLGSPWNEFSLALSQSEKAGLPRIVNSSENEHVCPHQHHNIIYRQKLTSKLLRS